MNRIKKNKRGWIRITEAVVAILIMASVLIVIHTKQSPRVSMSNTIHDLQIRLLTDVAQDSLLRNATLYSNYEFLNGSFFDLNVPNNLKYKIVICNLSNTNECKVEIESGKSEVFVEDRIISSNLEIYQPKLLRLYIWENK